WFARIEVLTMRPSRLARPWNDSFDGLSQPAIAPPPPYAITAAATLADVAAPDLVEISTNPGFGTAPVSNTFVRPLAAPAGRNPAWAVFSEATSATAPVMSFSPTREPQKLVSTSDSSIALSMKPASLQPLCTNASFLPLSACMVSPTDE